MFDSFNQTHSQMIIFFHLFKIFFLSQQISLLFLIRFLIFFFRFGHGAFLLCLENLYKKITGNDLIYSALVGKPSEITYYHAHHKLLDHSKKINKDIPIKRLYGIG